MRWSLAAFALIASARAAGGDAGPTAVAFVAGGSGHGELVVYNEDGHALRRVVGFEDPAGVWPSGEGRFVVLDRRSERTLTEVDLSGAVLWSWHPPDGHGVPSTVSLLPSGGFLAVDGGVTEFSRDGRVLWTGSVPPTGSSITSAVRLPQGETLVATATGDRPLLLFRPGRDPVALALPGGYVARHRLRVTQATADGEFYLADHNWTELLRARLRDGALTIIGTVPLSSNLDVSPDGHGGLVFVNGAWSVGHRLSTGTLAVFRLPFDPTGVAFLEPDRLVVSLVRVPGRSWPDDRSAVPTSTFAWGRFLLWVVCATALAAGLVVWTFRLRRSKSTSGSAGDLVDSTADLEPTPPRSPLSLALALVFLVGLFLAAWGQLWMKAEFRRGWLPLYTAGALLAASASEAYRRRVLQTKEPFWQAVRAAGSDASPGAPLVAGATVVALGTGILFVLRVHRAPAADQVGLWVALLLLLVALSISFGRRPRRPQLLLGPFLPVAVGAYTLLYRLTDVPGNTHFDYVYYVVAAINLIQGRIASIWDLGFVPAPVVGLTPEVIGLALGGIGELGFRLGGVLFGLSGIAAAYLLGAAYRDRRTGVLAGLALAGSIPFMHFSRLSANGDSATAGLWTLALFALALRTNRVSWWILAGCASGFCFYVWPGSRAPLLACFLGGLILAFRSPRATARRWYGPPLMALAFAVWLAPIVPSWLGNVRNAFPRADASLQVVEGGEIHWERVRSSFGEPLAKSFGWFFVTADQSSQGTLSPGLNDVEAVLFAVGLFLALAEGLSFNTVLLLTIAIVCFVLGAFAGSPPWYTRMLPSAPVAAVLIARAALAGLDLLPLASARARRTAFILLAAVVVFISPFNNLRAYVRFETERHPLWDSTAIGHRLRTIPKETHVFLVTTNRPDWVIDPVNSPPRFGELLPYVWNRHVTEIAELAPALPLPKGERKALFLVGETAQEDASLLRRTYPGVQVEWIGPKSDPRPLALLVLIDD